MLSFDLEIVSTSLSHSELSRELNTHVSISLNHSGQIAATTMSVRLRKRSLCVSTLLSSSSGDLHCVQIMTVVKVLLGLRSPNFILIHIDEIHSEHVAGVTHVLKVHYDIFLSVM